MSAPDKQGWLELLTESKIRDFNEWRLVNLLVRPDISGMDFSNKVSIRCTTKRDSMCGDEIHRMQPLKDQSRSGRNDKFKFSRG